MKLHEEGQPLTTAYNQATKEFTALRARYEMASMAAELEARHHGAEFKETAFVSDLTLPITPGFARWDTALTAGTTLPQGEGVPRRAP